ncbi:hypothetical protein TGME49_204500 [Toxoplasma gondii ME49]|uniref:Uncharacterized protein n=2 Tax=Toxoplasma gondii TaxID=5811 RepID=S8GN83_TOXGM|nr:hypothetical protein TGME49_204500 [Toxoplasma gondii ME49]EPT30024.1 hypothetical protein TGME49_204500 [Toxoplasma gondii ME49]KYF44387.1 hypothetical protein TGARI_204500 [Toxoplasma gondii ARI]|eukprot:XP_002367722.2 hypothetical protein TGME49_204500 [Toxoplasma gondii ME49]
MHERPHGFIVTQQTPHDSKMNHSRLVISRSYENREMLVSVHFLRAPVRRRGIVLRGLLVSICGFLSQKGPLFERFSVITPTLSTINLPYPLFAAAQPSRETTDDLLVEDAFDNDTLQDGRSGLRGQKSPLLSAIDLDFPRNSSDPPLPLEQATEDASYKWIYPRYPGQKFYAPRGAESPQMAYHGEAYPKETEGRRKRSSFTDLTHTQNSLTASHRDTSSAAEPDGFVSGKASPSIGGIDVTLKGRERKRRAGNREDKRHSWKRRRPRVQQQKRVRRRRKTLDARLAIVTALLVGAVSLLGYQHVQLKRLKKKGDTLDALLSVADALAQRLHDESSTSSSTEVYKLMVDMMTQGQAALESHAELTTAVKRKRRIEQQMDARKKLVDHLRSGKHAQRKGVTQDVKHAIRKISEEHEKEVVELLEEAMKIIDSFASFAET